MGPEADGSAVRVAGRAAQRGGEHGRALLGRDVGEHALAGLRVTGVGRARVAVVAGLGGEYALAGLRVAGVRRAQQPIVAGLGGEYALAGLRVAGVRRAQQPVVAGHGLAVDAQPGLGVAGLLAGAGVAVAAVRVGHAVRLHLATFEPHALLASGAELTVVDLATAVVVDAVADLVRARVDGGFPLHAILGRSVSVTVGVRVTPSANAVTVAVGVAGVADLVLVRVLLPFVHDVRAVVHGVVHGVAVEVVVAAVAEPVPVQVTLGRVGNQRAVVETIEHAIVVVVRVHAVGHPVGVGVDEALVDRAAAVVVDAIADLLGVRMDRRVERRAVIAVECSVVVIVGVARVAFAVTIGVGLLGIHELRAIVVLVEDAIAVVVTLAGVTGPVVVGVELVGVAHERAVVLAVLDAIVVIVRIADVAGLVRIRIELIGVRVDRAVVLLVADQVPVIVVVACVTRGIAVEIRLRNATPHRGLIPAEARDIPVRPAEHRRLRARCQLRRNGQTLRDVRAGHTEIPRGRVVDALAVVGVARAIGLEGGLLGGSLRDVESLSIGTPEDQGQNDDDSVLVSHSRTSLVLPHSVLSVGSVHITKRSIRCHFFLQGV